MDARRRVRISKFLSYVLRHKPERIGVAMDAQGWVSVRELIEKCRARGKPISLEELEEVVATNDKQRFALSEDGTRIRASQGHSIRVDLGYEPQQPPEVLYHGTAARVLPAIRKRGLTKGRRHDVHLSLDAASALAVGGRHGRPVVLTVEAGRMHRDGFAFRLTDNGVWITDHVPPAYLVFP